MDSHGKTVPAIETYWNHLSPLFITLPSLIHHSPRFCKVTLEIPTNLQCPQAHLPSAFVPRPNIWRFEKNQQCCRKCSLLIWHLQSLKCWQLCVKLCSAALDELDLQLSFLSPTHSVETWTDSLQQRWLFQVETKRKNHEKPEPTSPPVNTETRPRCIKGMLPKASLYKCNTLKVMYEVCWLVVHFSTFSRLKLQYSHTVACCLSNAASPQKAQGASPALRASISQYFSCDYPDLSGLSIPTIWSILKLLKTGGVVSPAPWIRNRPVHQISASSTPSESKHIQARSKLQFLEGPDVAFEIMRKTETSAQVMENDRNWWGFLFRNWCYAEVPQLAQLPMISMLPLPCDLNKLWSSWRKHADFRSNKFEPVKRVRNLVGCSVGIQDCNWRKILWLQGNCNHTFEGSQEDLQYNVCHHSF